jgi:hypothetical protein
MTINLKDWIKSLGSTADDVAEGLYDRSSFGLPRNCGNCPLVNDLKEFIAQTCPDEVTIRVSFRWSEVEHGNRSYHIDHPPQVWTFISEFDSMKHPDLILKNKDLMLGIDVG